MILDSAARLCPGNPVFLPFFHASADIFLSEMLCGMLTNINNVGGREGGRGTDRGTKIISCHRVYGSLALVEHRERVSISRQRSGWRAKGGRTILFSRGVGAGRKEGVKGERVRGHTLVPLTLDVFVNVNTSSADRHVNVTVDHARTGEERESEKKEHEETRKNSPGD